MAGDVTRLNVGDPVGQAEERRGHRPRHEGRYIVVGALCLAVLVAWLVALQARDPSAIGRLDGSAPAGTIGVVSGNAVTADSAFEVRYGSLGARKDRGGVWRVVLRLRAVDRVAGSGVDPIAGGDHVVARVAAREVPRVRKGATGEGLLRLAPQGEGFGFVLEP